MTDQATIALNVWASKCHHEAQGGAGYPDFLAVFNEPAPVPPDSRSCERADDLYDATPKKYRPTGIAMTEKWSEAVLSRWEAVERCIVDAPDWLRGYLLFKYPTDGLYAPPRGKETAFVGERGEPVLRWVGLDPDYPDRSFVDTFGDEVFWASDKWTKRAATALVASVERKMYRVLREAIKNL